MYTTIQKDLIAAMKAHDKKRLDVIKLVKAAIDKERIDKKCEITDQIVLDVLAKQVKLRQDSILEFEKAKRDDLVAEAKEEIEILQNYLPEPLKEEEVDAIIQNTIKELQATSIKDMGNVMKIVTPQVKGRYDMKQVSEKIKNQLN